MFRSSLAKRTLARGLNLGIISVQVVVYQVLWENVRNEEVRARWVPFRKNDMEDTFSGDLENQRRFQKEGWGIIDATETSNHMEEEVAEGRFSGVVLTNARCRGKWRKKWTIGQSLTVKGQWEGSISRKSAVKRKLRIDHESMLRGKGRSEDRRWIRQRPWRRKKLERRTKYWSLGCQLLKSFGNLPKYLWKNSVSNGKVTAGRDLGTNSHVHRSVLHTWFWRLLWKIIF